ncbi:MAG: hypothetical protein SH817_00535 [Leptospira sp.]|nr:hypothetical protein [Leptospira sp.]
MKNFKNITIIIITLNLFFIGCKKDEPVDLKTYGEYFRLLQNNSSGNCALIEKSTGSDGTAVYSATASVVASGRCRENTFHTLVTNAQDAKNASDSYYNGLALTFDKYNECSDLIKTSIASRELVSVTSLTEAANASPNGCYKVVPRVYLCKDEASLSALRNTFRYHTITNAKADMKVSYDSIVTSNAIINKTLDLKYEELVIGNLRLVNAAEITLFDGAEANALLPSITQDAACFKKVILGNTTLKSAYAKIPSLQEFFKEEINVSDRKAITETITPSLLCRYGTSAGELPASGATPASGICPSTYPVF